jgi:hypothetical protein
MLYNHVIYGGKAPGKKGTSVPFQFGSKVTFVVVLSHVTGDEDLVELKGLSTEAVIGQPE